MCENDKKRMQAVNVQDEPLFSVFDCRYCRSRDIIRSENKKRTFTLKSGVQLQYSGYFWEGATCSAILDFFKYDSENQGCTLMCGFILNKGLRGETLGYHKLGRGHNGWG